MSTIRKHMLPAATEPRFLSIVGVLAGSVLHHINIRCNTTPNGHNFRVGVGTKESHTLQVSRSIFNTNTKQRSRIIRIGFESKQACRNRLLLR